MVPDEEGETGNGPEKPNCSVCTRVEGTASWSSAASDPASSEGGPHTK